MARMVFLDELKPGMVLAYPILSDRGLLLLSEGVVLGGEHLRMLRANGVLYALHVAHCHWAYPSTLAGRRSARFHSVRPRRSTVAA